MRRLRLRRQGLRRTHERRMHHPSRHARVHLLRRAIPRRTLNLLLLLLKRGEVELRLRLERLRRDAGREGLRDELRVRESRIWWVVELVRVVRHADEGQGEGAQRRGRTCRLRCTGTGLSAARFSHSLPVLCRHTECEKEAGWPVRLWEPERDRSWRDGIILQSGQSVDSLARRKRL